MSRFRTITALVIALALALVIAACGGGGDGGGSDANPQEVVESATLTGVDSADLDLALTMKASGEDGGDVDLKVSGPFESQGEGKTPRLAIALTAEGTRSEDDIDVDAGLVLLPNAAFVQYKGVDYEVDPATFGFVESLLNQSQGGGGGSEACQEAAGKLDFASFMSNLENEGTADVGGTDTTKVSGDLDVPAATKALREVSEDPACASQLDAAGEVPGLSELEESEKELDSSLKSAHIELYVGDDDIIRRVVADVAMTPKGDDGKRREVDVDLDLTLSKVNEEQEIEAPAEAKPLSDLFIELGVNPLELAGALQGGEGLGSVLEQLGPAAGLDEDGGARGAWQDCIGAENADLAKCAELLR